MLMQTAAIATSDLMRPPAKAPAILAMTKLVAEADSGRDLGVSELWMVFAVHQGSGERTEQSGE